MGDDKVMQERLGHSDIGITLNTDTHTVSAQHRRTASRCFDEFGFYGVSVFVAVDMSVEDLCRSVDAVRRYGRIRRSSVARLHEDGFALLATGQRPHFDIVLPDLSDRVLERLAACFDPPEPNVGRAP